MLFLLLSEYDLGIIRPGPEVDYFSSKDWPGGVQIKKGLKD